MKLSTEDRPIERQEKQKKPTGRKQTCRKDVANKPPASPSKPKLKKRSTVACRGCGVVENSDADKALGSHWIQCGPSGRQWWHEVCGENGGIFDDDFFTCPQGIQQQQDC